MVPDLDDLPNDIKSEFEKLSMIEEMIIAPVIAIMQVYRLPNGALTARGFVANFAQDINEITRVLPRLPKDLPILILKKVDQQNRAKQFMVNRNRIQKVLTYLCENNQMFIENNIKMDNNRLEALPVDGIPEDLPQQDDCNSEFDKIIFDNGPQSEEVDGLIEVSLLNNFVYYLVSNFYLILRIMRLS